MERGTDDLLGPEAQPALGLNRVTVDEAGVSGVLVHALEQRRVVQDDRGRGNAVAPELAGLPDQPGRVSQRSDRNGTVVGGHAAELAVSHQRGACPQVTGTKRRQHTRRTGTDHQDVQHTQARVARYRSALSPGRKK
jgi:hypothetical protein